MKTSDIFITAGKFKHLRLTTPGGSTHPMGERERLALFNMLDCEGKDVLDLFAGSGALGLEAISRGAASATFIDKNTDAIKKNIAKLQEFMQKNSTLESPSATPQNTSQENHPAFKVFKANVLTHPADTQYDIVLVDPPYDHPEFFTQQSISIYSNFVKYSSTLVLSRPKTAKITPPESLKLEKTRTYAGLALDFFLKV